jgi:hypothetical protein
LGNVSPSFLQNQHTIPVAVEAVFFFHCLTVGLKHDLSASKGTNEHEESALGKVEIG